VNLEILLVISSTYNRYF